MTEIQTKKQYDLEDRTQKFAKDVIAFTKGLQKTTVNVELVKQLVRSSTSVGANYIEANEALSKKDFVMRIKICRKEARESVYWLKLVEIKSPESIRKQEELIEEATQLVKISSSIVEKAK
jgi:four helix bundle protein